MILIVFCWVIFENLYDFLGSITTIAIHTFDFRPHQGCVVTNCMELNHFAKDSMTWTQGYALILLGVLEINIFIAWR